MRGRVTPDSSGLPTLLFAVNHHEAELAAQPADGSCRQSQQGSKPLPVRLAEANYWIWGGGRAHVLAPLQAFHPWQRALGRTKRKLAGDFMDVLNCSRLPVYTSTAKITGQTISLACSRVSLKASWTKSPIAAGSSPSIMTLGPALLTWEPLKSCRGVCPYVLIIVSRARRCTGSSTAETSMPK